MRTASTIFTIIGMLANLSVAIFYSQTHYPIAWIFWIIVGICWILGIASIASSKKSIFLGVAMIFFVNVLSGVFYLCWDGEAI